METLKEIIKRNTVEYPNMEMQDAVKLVYQHTFGMDEEVDMAVEYEQALKDPADYLCEDIGGGYYRVHLNGLPCGNLTIEKLADIMQRSTEGEVNSEANGEIKSEVSGERNLETFAENLSELYDVVREGYFNFEYKEFQKFLLDYEEKGYPVLEHSTYFKNQYEPHYVVVKQEILNAEKTSFSKVFLKIYDRKLQAGEITFSKLGVPKPLFVVICNNQNYRPSCELLEKLRLTMKLTPKEAKELYESAGFEYLE